MHLSVFPYVSLSDNFTDLLMGTRFSVKLLQGPYRDVNVLQNLDE